MITLDLHTHTKYSHGLDSPEDMFSAARAKGITLYGFSEHSPRPHSYNYTHEYREHLTKNFPRYVQQVRALQELYPGQVLLGMEMDWMDTEMDFILASIKAYDFDYLIGSVHFLKTWGYDDDPGDWENCDKALYSARYEEYFQTLARMARSGLFNIAAHPDLIKIFSASVFQRWLAAPYSMDLIRDALLAIKSHGMAMEVSSAGTRKPCKEFYPGPKIMQLAADLEVPISLGSDAHAVAHAAYNFDSLEAYVRSFGYTSSLWFCQGQVHSRTFAA
ncbi:MAG: histidinol-phosphatase [Desulfovibrionaceae bacterium]